MSPRGIRLGWQSVFCGVLVAAACAQGQSNSLESRLAQGQQLRAAGRYKEAEQSLTDLLRDARRQSSGVLVAEILDNLGATEQDLANYVEAERLLTEGLAVLKRAGHVDGINVAVVQGHLGETYLEEARYNEADPVLRRALEMLQNDEHADPEKVAIAMLDLAMACEHTNRTREAEELFRQALAIVEASRGPDHPLLAAVLGPLSALLTRTGRYDEALANTERAWQILNGNPAVGEPDRLNTMSALGSLYSRTGKLTQADFYAKLAVTEAERIYGPDHPRLGYYLKVYAQVLKRENRKAEAKAVQRRSDAILTRNVQTNLVSHTINVNALR